MRKPKFKLYDRVVVIRLPVWDAPNGEDLFGPALHARGRVVAPKTEWDVAVDFDVPFGEGHTCGGRVRAGRGYYCDANALMLEKKFDKMSKPKATPESKPIEFLVCQSAADLRNGVELTTEITSDEGIIWSSDPRFARYLKKQGLRAGMKVELRVVSEPQLKVRTKGVKAKRK